MIRGDALGEAAAPFQLGSADKSLLGSPWNSGTKRWGDAVDRGMVEDGVIFCTGERNKQKSKRLATEYTVARRLSFVLESNVGALRDRSADHAVSGENKAAKHHSSHL